MNWLRAFPATVAGLAFLFGVVAFVAPGLLLAAVSEEVLYGVQLFGLLAVYGFLFVLLMQSGRIVRLRRRTSPGPSVAPKPELPRALATPGDELARRVDGLSARSEDDRRAIRKRIEASTHTDSLADRSTDGDSEYERYHTALDGALRACYLDAVAYKRCVRRAMVDAAADAGVETESPGVLGAGSVGATVENVRVGGTVRTEGTGSEGPEPDDGDGPIDAANGEWRSTGRWYGISAVGLVGIVFGVAYESEAVLLAGAIGIGFAAYALAESRPDVDLAFERTVSERAPAAGDVVHVTVSVRNEGESRAADVRIVDGVPEALGVTSGSPRAGFSLAPGAATSFTYGVEARRGVHRFDPPTVTVRGANGTLERTVDSSLETSIRCVPTHVPLGVERARRTVRSNLAGRAKTNRGGDGTEFHTVRDHRPADPRNRIDWRRFARTGELATVNYRASRARTIVLLVDGRPSAYTAPSTRQETHDESAVDRSVEAAGRLFATMAGEGTSVAVAGIGAGDDPLWIPPATGNGHASRVRRALATSPVVSPLPPDAPRGDEETALGRLVEAAPSGSEVWFLSPLCDDGAVDVVERIRARGHPTVAVSVDPTSAEAPEFAIARVERRLRVEGLRRGGVGVVDWAWDEPLEAALSRRGAR